MSRLFHKIGYSLRHRSEVGVTMQRKLTVYFACTVLVVFAAGCPDPNGRHYAGVGT